MEVNILVDLFFVHPEIYDRVKKKNSDLGPQAVFVFINYV
jgi:hypothetical protein